VCVPANGFRLRHEHSMHLPLPLLVMCPVGRVTLCTCCGLGALPQRTMPGPKGRARSCSNLGQRI
jgi:hypothetical protein